MRKLLMVALAAGALASQGASLADLIGARLPHWIDSPARFLKDTVKTDPEGGRLQIDPTQAEILYAVAHHDKVIVRSSHGIGKTATASWLTLWWLATRGPAAKVVTFAGTWAHLRDKLWPEIVSWGTPYEPDSDSGYVLHDAFEWLKLKIRHALPRLAERCFAVAAASNKPGRVEGFHSPNLLIIIDEAKSLPDEIWNAIQGALTQVSRTGARPKIVVLSTPPEAPVGWYAGIFRGKGTGWKRIHIPATHSRRVSKDWVEDMARVYGKGSAIYQSKVLGEIPDAGMNVVIRASWYDDAQARAVVKDKRRPVLTCDVAREGDDLTVFGLIYQAKFRILGYLAKNDVPDVVDALAAYIRKYSPGRVIVDDTGVGGGVTDYLRKRQREAKGPEAISKDVGIIGEKFGATAGREDRFAKRKYELWWALREALRLKKLSLPTEHELYELGLPSTSDLREQMLMAIYESDDLSRLVVLDKRDGREKTKALPTKSPDLAHAAILGVKHYFEQQPVTEPEPPKNTEEQFQANLRRMMQATHRRQRGKSKGPYGGRLR